MIDERQVREMLHQRADAIVAVPRDPATAIQKAQRGMMMTGLIGGVALIVAIAAIMAIAAMGGERAVLEPSLPLVPSVTPPPESGPEPAGNGVAYGRTDLMLVGVPGGRAVPFEGVIAGIRGAHEITVSPDRRRAAFVAHLPGTTPYGIFMVDLSDPADEPSQIAPELAMPSGGGVGTTLGGWSQDGTRLIATDAAEHSIWLIDATSGEATRVLDGSSLGGATVLAATFVPGQEAISFTAMDAATGGREDASLWTMQIGGQPSKLIDHAAFGSYSPDGSTIAYRSIHPGSPIGIGDLMLADADGTGTRVLTPEGVFIGLGAASAAHTEWSPDGSKLLVSPPGYGWPNLEGFTILDVATGRERELGSGQSATWWDDDTVLIGSYGCKDFQDC